MYPQQRQHLDLLFQQSRYAEAESLLKTILSQSPDDAEALLLTAVTLYHQDKDEESHGAILVSLRFEPENDRAHAWKSRILMALYREKEALAAADHALSLDAGDPFNWTTRALIHVQKRRWAQAEADAREALELDPDDEGAHHVLSQTLLYQGKAHENEANIANRLADDPENPIAHCNAGFAALRRRDHRKAGEHFAEALRQDASCEMARDGLIESYRARSAFYRLYLAFSFRMAAFSEKFGSFLMIGIWLLYRTIRGAVQSFSPALAAALAFAYLTFVFWSYVARGLSTFFLLTDRFARQALRPKEKLEGLVVGGGFTIGAILIGAGMISNQFPLSLIGGALAAQAVPSSLFFIRESAAGRWLYGTAAVITAVCGIGAIITFFTAGSMESEASPDAFTFFLLTGLIVACGTTFLAAFGVAKR